MEEWASFESAWLGVDAIAEWCRRQSAAVESAVTITVNATTSSPTLLSGRSYRCVFKQLKSDAVMAPPPEK